MYGLNGAQGAMTVAGLRERTGARPTTSAIRQRTVSGLWSGVRMGASCFLCRVVGHARRRARSLGDACRSRRPFRASVFDHWNRWRGPAGGTAGVTSVRPRRADRLRGNGGHDVLLGGGGGDLLQGKAGRDRLDGGPGNDRAFGGAGADDMRGGSGSDILGGGLGPDGLSGGSGRDIVVYGQRRPPVIVTIGAGANDGLAAERDNVKADVESVQTGRGNDVITGNGASNRLFGGGGKDRLVGKGGSDVLIGAEGDDGSTPARARRRRGARRKPVPSTAWSAAAGMTLRSSIPSTSSTRLRKRGWGGPGTPLRWNRPPTGIALSPTSVAENQPAGTTVGALSAGDPDPGDTHSFALVPGQGSDDNGSFQIVGTTLRTNAVFNYEAKNTYTVRIRATDFGTPAGQIVRAFTITVTDVNDPPTAVDDSATVVEDSGAGESDRAGRTNTDSRRWGDDDLVGVGSGAWHGGRDRWGHGFDVSARRRTTAGRIRSRISSTAARPRPSRSRSRAPRICRWRSTMPPRCPRTRPRPRWPCWPTTATSTVIRRLSLRPLIRRTARWC